jgi:hypothetical protein
MKQGDRIPGLIGWEDHGAAPQTLTIESGGEGVAFFVAGRGGE